ncbi:hypothetical protein Syun_030801 [Stephania yunnanensis]|uniref:Uncharacterized protein n=1 Tax=Stephania yunnanensis TaxID=152371 RepID=A0AAP0HED2_9MAGN
MPLLCRFRRLRPASCSSTVPLLVHRILHSCCRSPAYCTGSCKPTPLVLPADPPQPRFDILGVLSVRVACYLSRYLQAASSATHAPSQQDSIAVVPVPPLPPLHNHTCPPMPHCYVDSVIYYLSSTMSTMQSAIDYVDSVACLSSTTSTPLSAVDGLTPSTLIYVVLLFRCSDSATSEYVSCCLRQLRYTEDKGTTHLPAIHGGLLKPDVVEGTDDERVWSLPCWDLTETSKRDDGIDLLKDIQALQRLTGTAEKAKMDLSSLTQSNISQMEHTAVSVDEMMSLGSNLIDVNVALIKRSVREVAELYGSEKSFVFEVQRALSGLHYTVLIALERNDLRSQPLYLPLLNELQYVMADSNVGDRVDWALAKGCLWKTYIKSRAKLQRRRQELTHTTPDQPVDDEVVYYKVAGERPKGRVYGLGSLGRKKRTYADVDASTSQVLAQ